MQGYEVQQSSAAYPLVFLLVSSTDHISPVTGATPTVTISKAGGAFAAPAGAVSEIGDGWYKVAGNATDTGTLGPLILHATATGADPTDMLFPVVAYDPQSATNLGLTNLDAAVSTRSTYAGGAVASVTAAVNINLSQPLNAARNVGAVADTSLTLNDGFHCAIAAAAGKESVSGTTYLVQTPSTGTTLRSFTLDSGTDPTTRS